MHPEPDLKDKIDAAVSIVVVLEDFFEAPLNIVVAIEKHHPLLDFGNGGGIIRGWLDRIRQESGDPEPVDADDMPAEKFPLVANKGIGQDIIRTLKVEQGAFNSFGQTAKSIGSGDIQMTEAAGNKETVPEKPADIRLNQQGSDFHFLGQVLGILSGVKGVICVEHLDALVQRPEAGIPDAAAIGDAGIQPTGVAGETAEAAARGQTPG